MILRILAVVFVSGAVLSGGPYALGTGPETACGDVNGDAAINITDAVYLLNYLFRSGDAPVCSVVPVEDDNPSCGGFSHKAVEACRHDALADYWMAQARCDTSSDAAEVADCRLSAQEDLTSALEDCEEQLEARLDLCEVLGDSPYTVAIDSEDFVQRIDNTYLPLEPGLLHVFESQTAEGTRRRNVSVTHATREILGVPCVAVKTVETLDGELAEEAHEWYAQDSEGNVWIFGERSLYYEDGEILDLEAWTAGFDGAVPAIVMKGSPGVGDVYYRQFALGVAEDVGKVVSVSESVPLPALGIVDSCVQIAELSPLEPNGVEQKFYAPGVGMVLELDLQEGGQMELVEIGEASGR